MATADIQVQIPPNPVADGRPAQVIPFASLPVALVNLTNLNNVGVVSWLWELVDAPSGSAAALSAPDVPAPTLGPIDLPGTYHVRLSVNAASGDWQIDAEVDEVVVRARNAAGVVIPAVGETVQGGSDGWADWLSGMNDALVRLSTARTLQGAYDVSTPPRILVAPASGPVELGRNIAGAGEVLRLSSVNGALWTATWTVDELGRMLGTPALAGVLGAVAMDVNVPGAMDCIFARWRDSVLGSYFQIGQGQAPSGIAIWTAAGPTRGFDLDLRSFPSAMVRFQNSLGSGGDPLRWVLDNTGGIEQYSKSSTYGYLLDAKGATTDIARMLNSSYAGLLFRIREDGTVLIKPGTGSGDAGLEIDARTSAIGLINAYDSLTNRRFRVYPDGRLYSNIEVVVGDDGVFWDFTGGVSGGAASLHTIGDGGGFTWSIFPSGRISQLLGYFSVEAGGTRNQFHQDWTTIANVLNGETRRGFYVNGSALAVAGGGVWRGFLGSLLGAVAGDASVFQALVTNQDVPAYKVGVGAGGTAFGGHWLWGVADAGPSQWTPSYQTATGGASGWQATAGSLYHVIPVHVPPGSTITAYAAWVNAVGAGLAIFLVRHDNCGATPGHTQTQLSTAVTGGAGAQALGAGGLAIAVPRDSAAVKYSFYLILESAANGDWVYSGFVKYDYTELLLGG